MYENIIKIINDLLGEDFQIYDQNNIGTPRKKKTIVEAVFRSSGGNLIGTTHLLNVSVNMFNITFEIPCDDLDMQEKYMNIISNFIVENNNKTIENGNSYVTFVFQQQAITGGEYNKSHLKFMPVIISGTFTMSNALGLENSSFLLNDKPVSILDINLNIKNNLNVYSKNIDTSAATQPSTNNKYTTNNYGTTISVTCLCGTDLGSDEIYKYINNTGKIMENVKVYFELCREDMTPLFAFLSEKMKIVDVTFTGSFGNKCGLVINFVESGE